MNPPRILIAGLRGSSGKTLITLGIHNSAWSKPRTPRGYLYRRGPIIDAAWLSVAAGTACRNLDLFLMVARDHRAVVGRLGPHGRPGGHRRQSRPVRRRGHPGYVQHGRVGEILQAPVVFAVDCTKSIRTVAATILGCQRSRSAAKPLRSVILNQVAGPAA